jgi:hypothetical protein
MLSATRFDPAVVSLHRAVSGSVERVFENHLYARDSRFGDWFVVALDAAGGQPHGVNVKGVMDLRFVAREGATVWVDLSGARAWSPELPPESMCKRDEALITAVRLARATAAEAAGDRGLSALLRDGVSADVLSRIALGHIASLAYGIANDDAMAAVGAVRGLQGLGIGLTPSGDDVIVGVLAALEATSHPARPAIAATALPDGKARTTELAWRAITHAVEGQYPERLHDVLAAIASGEPAEIDRAVKSAIHWGGTSAVDSLVGLFVGLDAAARSDAAATQAREVAAVG